MKLSWSPNALGYTRLPRAGRTCQFITGGRLLFTARASYGNMSTRVLAWCRAFMEAIVELKWASTPGDTRLPPTKACTYKFIIGGASTVSFRIYALASYTRPKDGRFCWWCI